MDRFFNNLEIRLEGHVDFSENFLKANWTYEPLENPTSGFYFPWTRLLLEKIRQY